MLIGAAAAPLLPFIILAAIPSVVVLCGAPLTGIFFAILIDSFLIPEGIMPFYGSSIFYAALSLLLYVYLRYTTP